MEKEPAVATSVEPNPSDPHPAELRPAETHRAEFRETVAALEVSAAVVETPELTPSVQENQAGTDDTSAIKTIAFGNLRRCETCGFPVSEGRRLCLDCEAATPDAVASIGGDTELFGELTESNPSWMQSHMYLIATALVALATIALLAWRL